MTSSFAEIRKFLDEHQVTLVAVSKMKTTEEIMSIYTQGQRIFGENKVREMVQKKELLPADVQWHLVGHLQTNKVKQAVPFVSLIHSVESRRLLEEINKQAKKIDRLQDVLLQVYIAQEETKFGLSFDEVRELLSDKNLTSLDNIRICGLMGMATFTENMQQVRREFKSLKNFFDEMKSRENANCKMEILSMGMSGDYKIAIEEGSTMVRIGSAIFGERNSPLS